MEDYKRKTKKNTGTEKYKKTGGYTTKHVRIKENMIMQLSKKCLNKNQESLSCPEGN